MLSTKTKKMIQSLPKRGYYLDRVSTHYYPSQYTAVFVDSRDKEIKVGISGFQELEELQALVGHGFSIR